LLIFLFCFVAFGQEKTSKEFQDELNSEYADAKKSPLLPE
jgi:hypothetical protein